MRQAVAKHQNRQRKGNPNQDATAAKGKRRHTKEQQNADTQARQPDAEGKCRQRQEWQALTDGTDSRIINGEKIRHCLIGYVQGEGSG